MWGFRCFVTVTVILSAIAYASSRALPSEIKVLSAESQTVKAPPITPPDCNWQDLSAYCYSSKPIAYFENTMVIQESDGRSLKISCTAYNRWSHCVDLPINQTFQATMEKHGLEIRYLDKNHKMRKQMYEILPENESSR